jgi:plastocyanin
MKGRLLLAGGLALAATCLVPAVGQAGIPNLITVEAEGEDVFSPELVTADVNANYAFEWSWGTGTIDDHNVRQDSKLFYSGPPSDDEAPFEVLGSAGTFHYYCEAHGSKAGGMDGVIALRPNIGMPPLKRGAAPVVSILWASSDSETGDQYDVQYKVGKGDWKSWKKNTAKQNGLFGRNGKPVTVKKGKSYKVRARSEKSSNAKKRSGWSPPLAFGSIP